MRLSILLAGAALLSATTAYLEDADEYSLPRDGPADSDSYNLFRDFKRVCSVHLRNGKVMLEFNAALGASFDEETLLVPLLIRGVQLRQTYGPLGLRKCEQPLHRDGLDQEGDSQRVGA
jgi:hypothetical protein